MKKIGVLLIIVLLLSSSLVAAGFLESITGAAFWRPLRHLSFVSSCVDNGVCEVSYGETSVNCPKDCGVETGCSAIVEPLAFPNRYYAREGQCIKYEGTKVVKIRNLDSKAVEINVGGGSEVDSSGQLQVDIDVLKVGSMITKDGFVITLLGVGKFLDIDENVAFLEVKPEGQVETGVSEQVKCVFDGSSQEQKCYTAEGFSCKGVNACVVDVYGQNGKKLTWKSSCGGYAYTTIDGNTEYAEFDCTSSVPQGETPCVINHVCEELYGENAENCPEDCGSDGQYKSKCSDSDGGFHVYEKGRLEVWTPSYGSQVIHEYCANENGESVEEGDFVEELVCMSGDSEYAYSHKRTRCENGCIDGACLSAQASCIDRIRNQGEEQVDCGGPCPPCEGEVLTLEDSGCKFYDWTMLQDELGSTEFLLLNGNQICSELGKNCLAAETRLDRTFFDSVDQECNGEVQYSYRTNALMRCNVIPAGKQPCKTFDGAEPNKGDVLIEGITSSVICC